MTIKFNYLQVIFAIWFLDHVINKYLSRIEFIVQIERIFAGQIQLFFFLSISSPKPPRSQAPDAS